MRAAADGPAKQLVEDYFNPSGNYAAALFNTLAPNPPNEFASSDFLAVSLLRIQFYSSAIVALTETCANEIERHLKDICDDMDIWSPDAPKHLLRARDLYNYLRSSPHFFGVGHGTAAKLLARKRPRLVPMHDRFVTQFFGLDTNEILESFWLPLHSALTDTAVRETVDQLRAEEHTDGVPTLRLLDVAIWMRRGETP